MKTSEIRTEVVDGKRRLMKCGCIASYRNDAMLAGIGKVLINRRVIVTSAATFTSVRWDFCSKCGIQPWFTVKKAEEVGGCNAG